MPAANIWYVSRISAHHSCSSRQLLMLAWRHPFIESGIEYKEKRQGADSSISLGFLAFAETMPQGIYEL